MTADYSGLLGRLRSASGTYAGAVARVRAEWQDAAAAAAAPNLSAVSTGFGDLTAAVTAQQEAHSLVERLAELVDRHAEDAARELAQARAASGEAERSVAAASASAGEARAAASASSARVREALQLAGQAGAACGQASEFGALEGLMQQRVEGERRGRVLKMASKALAVEGAWMAGEQVVTHAAPVLDGLPADVSGQVKETLQVGAPVLTARLSAFATRIAARWRR